MDDRSSCWKLLEMFVLVVEIIAADQYLVELVEVAGADIYSFLVVGIIATD